MMEDIDAKQLASDLQKRIADLDSLSGVDLKNEMANLKQSLMQNPSACMLLMEEDIGKLVSSLRRMLGNAVVSAAAVKTRSTSTAKSKTKLSVDELNNILEANL